MENYVAATFNTLMLMCATLVVLGLLVTFVKAVKRDTYKDGFNEGFGAYRNYINNTSWWFSEHPPTSSLLRNIVEDSSDRYAIRETWRKALSEYHQLTPENCNNKDKEHQEMFHDKND